MNTKQIILHAFLLTGTIALTVLCMVYPFLPGAYDSLAVPLSTMVQAGAGVGLIFVPIGLLWLTNPRRGHVYGIIAMTVGLLVAAVVVLVAFASVGPSLGVLTLALFVYVASRFTPRLKSLQHTGPKRFRPAPLYLIFIPAAVVAFQVLFAAPITEWSRNHAIVNGGGFIGDIEAYRTKHGRYPESLLAQWKDYYPDVVGVEKFHYSPDGDSYNLFFEQPRFLFDNIGAREWVVYNPRDTHRMYSHTAWLLILSPEQVGNRQGWYAVHDTQRPHWKYFWFD